MSIESIYLNGMRCTVLGASGFLGRNLCTTLCRHGVAVRAFSRHRPADGEADPCNWVVGDFSDEHRVTEAIRGSEVVFHLVGSTNPASSNENALADAQTNLLTSIRLLQNCVREGVSRIVFVSSGGTVYGEPLQIPIPETHPTDPRCAYGITKLAVEKYLALYEGLHGLTGITLRVSNPYGPHQTGSNGQGVIGTFIVKALTGEVIEVWGDGSTIRDYVFVDDVVRSLEIAATYRGAARVFNIGSGVGVNINEIVRSVGKSVGRLPSVVYRAARSVDVTKSVLDCRLAKSELGWLCETPMATGIAATVQWFRDHGDGVSQIPSAFRLGSHTIDMP